MNGTVVNDVRLSSEREESSIKALYDGDVLVVGRTKFRVSIVTKFVSFDEEHEDEVEPLERQLHVSVPRIHSKRTSKKKTSSPERRLMEELARHEDRDRGDSDRDIAATSDGADWNEVRLTAEENLRNLDQPTPSRRLRLRERTKDIHNNESSQNTDAIKIVGRRMVRPYHVEGMVVDPLPTTPDPSAATSPDTGIKILSITPATTKNS